MTEPAPVQHAAGYGIAQSSAGVMAIVNITGWTAKALLRMVQQLNLKLIDQRSDAEREKALLDLREQLHVTREALVGFFEIIDEKEVPPEKLAQTLAEIAQRLLEHGVIIRPGGLWRLPAWARITIGTPEENVQLLAALSFVLRQQ